MTDHNSTFDAGLASYIWLRVWTGLVNVLTLGIAYPWTMCAIYGWRIRHSIISGNRLQFDGQGHQLIGKWVLWWLLTVITLGIYGFWVPIKLEKWRVSHTYMMPPEVAAGTPAPVIPATLAAVDVAPPPPPPALPER